MIKANQSFQFPGFGRSDKDFAEAKANLLLEISRGLFITRARAPAASRYDSSFRVISACRGVLVRILRIWQTSPDPASKVIIAGCGLVRLR